MKFKNNSNGYVEESSYIFLWTLLFGAFYFMYKGIWSHAFISLILGAVTFGISWFLYPFVAEEIVKKSYLQKGWSEFVDLPPIVARATCHHDGNITYKND